MNGRRNRIIFYSIYKEQYIILEKSNSVQFINIAWGNYKITILKTQPAQNISLTSVALSSQNISVNVKTGQRKGSAEQSNTTG